MKIPDKVTYVLTKPQEVSICWEGENTSIASRTVIPAFPVAEGEDLDKARKWAFIQKYGYYPNNGLTWKTAKFDEVTIINNGFKVQICGIVHRARGKSTYKIATPEGYYVDLREDVLLEALINEGAQAGGFLSGEYIWLSRGSQMKLIRKDSHLHKAQDAEELDPKTLEIGGVYVDKTNLSRFVEYLILLGYVKTSKNSRKFLPLWLITRKDTAKEGLPKLKEIYPHTLRREKIKVYKKINQLDIPKDFIGSLRDYFYGEYKKNKNVDTSSYENRHNKYYYYAGDMKNYFKSVCLMYQKGEKFKPLAEFK